MMNFDPMAPPHRSAETSEVLLLPTSVNLKDLLSYQDVMQNIEREFHLHEGQEREIIMKLWLKNQSMISILYRYRYLLQDLKLDDQDLLGGLKKIREMISYADRDVHHLRERVELLESQNQFLEQEFQRQLDRITREKNEHIYRLTEIIDQTCSNITPYRDPSITTITTTSSGIERENLLKKFMQQNVELQHEIEILRVKLEHTFTFVNDKLDQQKDNLSSASILKTALERIHQTEVKLHELQYKSSSQREENDLLKYLIEKSQQSSNTDQIQLIRTLEQRTLEREIERVRQELELTEKKSNELQKRFENADETIQFKLEQFQLTCDVLREHINKCNQRAEEINRQIANESLSKKNENEPLEKELSNLRERHNELLEHYNALKNELIRIQNNLTENKTKEEQNHSTEMKSLQKKYLDACERLNATTIETERMKIRAEQTSNRCDELEKEKAEIRQQSDHLTQNLVKMTAKYKEKMGTMKIRVEESDRQREDAQKRSEHLQNEMIKLHQELYNKEETIFEKERAIQYHQHEVHLEKQSIDGRRLSDEQQLKELTVQNRLLQDELDRVKKQLNIKISTATTTNSIDADSTLMNSRLEDLKTKMTDFEQRFLDEKSLRESLQIQMKILEEENTDLREIMIQMRKRSEDAAQKTERDRNDEIQQLIARAELHARQYMSTFNLHHFTTNSAIARIVPIASSSGVFS